MATAKITKRFVDGLKPDTKTLVVYDTELKGFGIRVMPAKTGQSMIASYFVEYRPDGGGRKVAKKRDSFGRVNELTPDEARKMASDKLAEVRKGNDPVKDKQTRRKGLRLMELIDLWDKENPPGRRSGKPMAARTKKNTLARLKHHVVPLLGRKRVVDVTAADVSDFVSKVRVGATASAKKPSGRKRGIVQVRGGDGAARKVAADLSIIMSYALEKGMIGANPVAGARRPREGKRHTFLSLEDIGKMTAAFDELEQEGVSKSGLDILRLLLLTGARPSEIEGLKWQEVDFTGKALRLTATKSGFSARPLSDEALAILTSIKEVHGSPYVFPASRGDGHFIGSKKIWEKARDRAKLPHVVRYEARHAVATLALSEGHDPASVAAIMGHAGPKTTLAVYAHLFGNSAVRAAENVGSKIAAAMKGKPQKKD